MRRVGRSVHAIVEAKTCMEARKRGRRVGVRGTPQAFSKFPGEKRGKVGWTFILGASGMLAF